MIIKSICFFSLLCPSHIDPRIFRGSSGRRGEVRKMGKYCDWFNDKFYQVMINWLNEEKKGILEKRYDLFIKDWNWRIVVIAKAWTTKDIVMRAEITLRYFYKWSYSLEAFTRKVSILENDVCYWDDDDVITEIGQGRMPQILREEEFDISHPEKILDLTERIAQHLSVEAKEDLLKWLSVARRYESYKEMW